MKLSQEQLFSYHDKTESIPSFNKEITLFFSKMVYWHVQSTSYTAGDIYANNELGQPSSYIFFFVVHLMLKYYFVFRVLVDHQGIA